MRKILVSQFLTLDGIMDGPEKWNPEYSGDSEVVHEILADLSASDLLLLGRTSYDFFAARWPSRTNAMADYFNNLPKLVVSTRLQKPEWNNTTIIRSTAVEEIKKRKEQPGKNILVIGSHKLVQTLMSENLIDEYKLYVYPLTLGKGKRLFEQGAAEQALELISAKRFASGVVSIMYQSGK
ncbi:MAG: dihydrofolate reductase family protein [Chryseolinea sp.]